MTYTRLYTDGSLQSHLQPKKSGIGWVVRYADGSGAERGLSVPVSQSNSLELQAIEDGLSAISKVDPIILYTDSAGAYNSLVHTGHITTNQDYHRLKWIAKACHDHNVTVCWLPRRTNIWACRADYLARAASLERQIIPFDRWRKDTFKEHCQSVAITENGMLERYRFQRLAV